MDEMGLAQAMGQSGGIGQGMGLAGGMVNQQ